MNGNMPLIKIICNRCGEQSAMYSKSACPHCGSNNIVVINDVSGYTQFSVIGETTMVDNICKRLISS